MARFVIHKRSQHAAAEADDSANVVVYDLFFGLDDETQARHLVFSESPFGASRLVAELGAAVSKEKLELAKEGPQVIQPGAVGSREQGQSVSGENTSTRIEVLDSGEMNVVSDEPDSKIYELSGSKLKGRMRMNRDGDSKRFNVAFEGQLPDGDGDVDPAAGSEEKEPVEDESQDPKRTDLDDFVRPEFDEILRICIEDKVPSDDILARLRAIRTRLSNNEMTSRDVVFVLRLLAGGEDAARTADKDADEVINLWDDAEWDGDDLIFLDAESGDEYRLQKNPDNGTFTIPRFEILREGVHNGNEFSKDRIKTIVQNFQKVSKTRNLDVPIKIGHHRNQSLKGDKGELAHGWVADAWEENDGERAFVKLEHIPKTLAFLLHKKALRNRSAEIFSNLEYEGRKIGPTLKAIALLGTSTPAVRGMQPDAADPLEQVVQMYEEDGQHVIIANLRSDKSMPDDNKQGDNKGQEDVITLSQAEFNKAVSEAANKAAQDAVEKMKEVHKRDTEELEAKLTSLGGQLDEEKARHRKQAIKAQREKNVLEFEALVKGGHITPAVKDDFVSLANILDGVTESAKGVELSDLLEGVDVDKDTMEFSIETVEDDKKATIKATPKALLVRLLRGQKQVDFSTQSNDNKDENKSELNDGGENKKSKGDQVEELTRKLMEEKQIDYADALEIAVSEVMGDKAHDEFNVTGL